MNSSVGLPFTKTEIEAVIKHSLSHILQELLNLIALIIKSKKNPINKIVCLFENYFKAFFASSTTSFAIMTPSKICRPFTNANWPSEINQGTNFHSLLANTLERMLYMQPISEIGVKSLTF